VVENLGDEPAPGEPSFEDVVSALLKVDPEGIVGQRAGKGKKAPSLLAVDPESEPDGPGDAPVAEAAENDEDPAPAPE
jgi:hypothetical protein